MLKCPACGLSALLHIIDYDTYIWNDTISVYVTYKCGCGRRFVTRTQTDRNNEQMYDIDI